MFNFTTNDPVLDNENRALFRAASLLENIGNCPGLTTNDFYLELLKSELPTEDHQSIAMAAIAIETMMGFEADEPGLNTPTIH